MFDEIKEESNRFQKSYALLHRNKAFKESSKSVGVFRTQAYYFPNKTSIIDV